jgi:xylose isomerase
MSETVFSDFDTAAKLLEEGKYDAIWTQRYAGWKTGSAVDVLAGKFSLDEIEKMALENKINPQPRSGKQEQIENLLARAIYSEKVYSQT